MSKRIDEIWSETPGLPKALLLGGIFLHALAYCMLIIGNWTFWMDLVNLARQVGYYMWMAGMVTTAASLIGGGLAAGKDKD